MLQLYIQGREFFNDETGMFETTSPATLQLEHSLISISKWESIWHHSFLSAEEITVDEFKSYVKCMTVNRVADDSIYDQLTTLHEKQIRAYIKNPMTATTVKHDDRRQRRRIITSEQIYGWMVEFGIPFDPCEKWHINRLMMLIDVCSAMQNPGKKRSAKEQAAWMRAQHASRKKRP